MARGVRAHGGVAAGRLSAPLREKVRRMKRSAQSLPVIMVVVLAVSAPSAFSAITEVEPNNSIATADLIPDGGANPWADVGLVALGVGGADVDFFKIWLDQDEVLTAITTPLAVLFTDPDTVMALYKADGTQLVLDDDSANSGGSKGSAVMYEAPLSAFFYIAVSGSGDNDFDGKLDTDGVTPHGEVGGYLLTVSVVPEPATLSLLALGGLAMLRRRKR